MTFQCKKITGCDKDCLLLAIDQKLRYSCYCKKKILYVLIKQFVPHRNNE